MVFIKIRLIPEGKEFFLRIIKENIGLVMSFSALNNSYITTIKN